MIAVALVGFIMLFFLHSLRDAFIAVVAIPLSLIATFIGLYVMGYTLNLMSLLGLSLVVGILVDDAIVVVEAVQHYMDHEGLSAPDATRKAMKDITAPVIAIALILAAQ